MKKHNASASGFRTVFPSAFLLCLSVFVFSACSHYRLGTGGKLAFQTLYIAPVENTANLPQAAALFTAQLRDAFVRDGRVRLADSPASADATLTVDLTRYDRAVTSSRRDDTGLARKFNLTLTAQTTLRDNRTGAVFFEKRPVQATRQIFTTPTPESTQSEQLQAEYNTMPLIASSLAGSVVSAVLDVW